METIGFDLDGVLYDIINPSYIELISFYDLKIPFNTFWKNHKNYYDEKFWENFFRIPILYEKSFPEDGAVDTLYELSKKYNIVYITARPLDVKFVTQYWLKKNKFPNHENLEFSNNKTVEVRQHNCKYFIEDNYEQEKIDALSKITNVLLVNQIYNEHINNVIKINSVNELKYLL
jgi:uncharacterized HAD superfamily protein